MFVYELPISLYSFKLRLAIALKGATVERRAPPGDSYRSAEFRAINPAGTIPALVDGDFVLPESDAIIEYLDDIACGAPLLPADARTRARTRMLSRWCDMRLEPPIRSLFPLVKARDDAAVAAADAAIAKAFALFEGALDEAGPHALGVTPGLADCGLTASLAWFDALTPALGLTARPGLRLTRLVEAMRAHDKLAPAIASYQLLVGDWIGNRQR